MSSTIHTEHHLREIDSLDTHEEVINYIMKHDDITQLALLEYYQYSQQAAWYKGASAPFSK